MTGSHAPRDIDTSKPHSARMYDYYLGGKDHFDVDKQAAERVASVYPGIFVCARENRAFMHRATRVLAREHGIRQWLDIGTGIPTEPNLHQVAQAVVPQARVVYADNDPLVLKYAETLMRSTPEGRTTYIEADANDPDVLLNSPELGEVLDLAQPVALSLNALLHFITDAQDPYGLVRRLMDFLPSGSALAISHCTPDFDPATWEKVTQIYNNGGTPVQFRSKAEVERFFEGLDLLEPGITVGHRWRPDAAQDTVDEDVSDATVSVWSGVGIKP
ncbi:S-adenosyl methyltransferase [Streptomyces sp. DvalAA-14]|uniref:SAM-dependent methyltransferase n=1 Tax=unclassified Streptomyces TaxID=2593676 RepID=UPI00081B1FA4|nr:MULTISPECIES: SAM-dependent methyltransferase [unclassified Streptomyces]MYS19469.1 SAM-dependent methyltransferase [Streptomyces sp. SID4948]SCD45164.1 S-adenosyl methyltransferase [Streptomyces sp. DvalAA-14]